MELQEASTAGPQPPSTQAAPIALSPEARWERNHQAGLADLTTTPDGYDLTLWNFQVNSAHVKTEHDQALGRHVSWLVNRVGPAGLPFYLTIEGHASGTGSADLDQRLSVSRAAQVKDSFERHLLAALRRKFGSLGGDAALKKVQRKISLRAAGSRDPRVENRTPFLMARNRRVEIRAF